MTIQLRIGLLLLLSSACCEAFFQSSIVPSSRCLCLSRQRRTFSPSTTICHLSSEAGDIASSPSGSNGSENNDDDEVAPGQMRISEIKSELDMRGIGYADCFDQESLAVRLIEARATGRANPDIIDKFNKAKLEQTFKEEKIDIKGQDLESMTANDGTLPGGLSPDIFQQMVANPELIAMLQSTVVQKAMKVIMTTGRPEDLEEAMKTDPELRETLGKLNEVMGNIGKPEEEPFS